MLTLETAKRLSAGTTIYSMRYRDSRGHPSRAKVTKITTWKTRPNEVQVNYKFGLYDYGTISAHQLDQWTTEEGEARLPYLDTLIADLRATVGAATTRPPARLLLKLRQLEEEAQRLRAEERTR